MDRPVFRRIDLTRPMDQSWTVGGPAPGICIVRGSDQYAIDPSQMPLTGGTYLAMPPGLPSAKLNPQGPGGVLLELSGEIDPAKTQPDVSMTFSNWVVDGNLPESVFQFTPPRGARKVNGDGQANEPAGDSLQGHPVPPAIMNLMHGGRVTPSRMKGKVLVLGFWSVGAPSSMLVLQAMAEIANQYCARGIAVYAVNVGDAPAKVREYLDQASMHVAVATDPAGDAARQYKIQAPPQVMIVDRRDIVQAANVPLGADLMQELQRDVEVVLAGKDLTAEKK